ncbi:MAG: TIR domain-containing protein [Bacteroidota bacterium]
MGGGGGGFLGGSSYGGASNISKLEDVARKELGKQSQPERRKVFISFKHEDKVLVEYLRGQAKNTNSNLDFIDMSLQVPFNSTNADYIKQGIRARIKQCSVTAVMVTDKTHKSEWVDWEIRESIRQGKGVIVIDKRENTSGKLPSAIMENKKNIKVVPWKHKEIMDAVDNAAEKR